jgi:hypothetical protein
MLLASGNAWLLLGKVTTPGDPDTVPSWVEDLAALAPLTDLAAVTDGTTITGGTQSSAATGTRVVINDPAYPGEIVLWTGAADELEPSRIKPVVNAGAAYLQLFSPKTTVGDAPAVVHLNSDDGVSSFEVDADQQHFYATSMTIDGFGPTGVRLGDGTDYVSVIGKAVQNADLTDPSNAFPATMTPRSVYKTTDTTISNSTSLATDPELQMTGIATGTYAIDALLIYSASAVADWKGFMTGTGSLADRLLQVLREPLSGNEYGLSEGAVTFTAAGNGVGAKRTIRIVGTFRATADGQTYNLQWAQNTAEATATVVHKGSFLRIQRIA